MTVMSMMLHRDLADAVPLPGGEDRDEAMQFPVDMDVAHDVQPVGLQAGVEIVQAHAGDA